MKIGIDIVEIERIARAVSNSERFRRRVFTQNELEYCRSRGKQADASLAGIFCAKEAFCKALGTGFRFGSWQELQISHDAFGAPCLELTGEFKKFYIEKNVKSISLSISHSRKYAVANVILES